MVAIWHYAQGVAAVRQDRLDEARDHHGSLAEAASNPAIENMKVWDRYSLIHAVRIAEKVLAAELAVADGDHDAAIAALRDAVRTEDQIPYDEPPGWHMPVRHTLGAVLLAADRPAEAEDVYLEELRRNPENGWSLYGLSQALIAQGRSEEGAAVAARFERAWGHSDIKLRASRL